MTPTPESLLESAEAILNRAEAEGRDLDEIERAEYDKFIDRSQRASKLRQVRTGIANGTVVVEPGFAAPTVVTRNNTDPWTGEGSTRSRALDAIERSEHVTDAAKERFTNVITADEDPTDLMARWALTSSDPNYLRAFNRVISDPEGGSMLWEPEERDAVRKARELQRAMSLTTTAGGFLVPFALDVNVQITNAGTSNTRLRDAFNVVTTAAGTWHGVSSAGITAAWYAEGAQVTDDAPTLAQPEITAFKGSAFVPMSFEAYGDMGPEGIAQVQKMLVDAKERVEAKGFITGAGTTEPTGIVTSLVAASKTVASTTANAYVVGDVYALKKALPARHRANAAWLANEDLYDLTRQFATGTGPQSAFWADFGEGTPPRLLGKPAFESSELDATYGSGENYVMIYGNLKDAYTVVDRVGTTIELIPNLTGANGRPTGQRGLLLWFRTGGDCVNADAARVLNIT